MKRARSLVSILALLACSVPAFAQASVGDISAAEDPRLARTVSLNLASGTAGEAFRSLSALTAVTFRIGDRTADDQGVRLALKDVPLSDVLTQMAVLFGWRWQRIVQDEEIVYRLTGTGNAGRGDPEAVRQTLAVAIREEAQKQWREAEPVLRAWIAAGGDLDAIKKSDPEIGALLEKDPEIGSRVRELSRLPESERRRWIEDRIYALLEKDGPRAKYALVARYVASQIPPSAEVPADNEPTVSIKLQGETPFWSVIEGLSKKTGISFVSDRYSRRIVVSGVDFNKAPLRKVLDDLCRQAVYSWTSNGGLIRLRSRLWFYDELREPPKSVIDRWLRVKKQRGKLSFSDLAGLAAALTDDQIAGLADSEAVGGEANLVTEGRNILDSLNEFRLYNALSRQQVLAAENAQGLSFLRMTPQQRDLFLRYAPPGPFPPENAIESALLIIIPRGQNSVTFKYAYGLGISRSREVMVAAQREAPAEPKSPVAPTTEEKPQESPPSPGPPQEIEKPSEKTGEQEL